jgi:hypothetical protein
MHRTVPFAGRIIACCLIAAASTFAHAQAAAPAKPAPGTPVPPSQALGEVLGVLEKEFVSAAQAMPDDKFSFAPTPAVGEFKGVRSFGDQVKHVAQANWYFFSAPGTAEADVKAKQAAIDKLTSKADIVAALKDSFTQAHAYVNGITTDNAWLSLPGFGTRASMASFGMAHLMDHYGQLAVYLRMNGIVPPASRPGASSM